MARMGFSDEDIRARNDKIIYVSISGFGETGPYADQRVYDPVIQALSGATDIQADRVTGKPTMFRVIVADKVASLTAAQAVASALFHRERSGEGQDIKLSMLDAMLSFFWPEAMSGLTFADNEWDPASVGASMDLVFKAKDGYITAGAISDREWAGMCRALDREDLIEDERFATARGRGINGDERKRITGDEIAKWHREEILERMRENEVPSAPLLKRMEIMDNDQILASESVSRTEYESFGEVRQAAPAARFSSTPSEIQGPAPTLGQQTAEILKSLGYSKEERIQLLDQGVVKQ